MAGQNPRDKSQSDGALEPDGDWDGALNGRAETKGQASERRRSGTRRRLGWSLKWRGRNQGASLRVKAHWNQMATGAKAHWNPTVTTETEFQTAGQNPRDEPYSDVALEPDGDCDGASNGGTELKPEPGRR